VAVPLPENATWERMIMAVEKVRIRLERAVAAFEAHGVPYAVIGGNAVANWVARVDEEAVRNTRDVDILIRRSDFPAAVKAMDAAGFDHVNVTGVDCFVERPNGVPSAGIHLIFADEKVKPTDPVPAPSVEDSEQAPTYRVLSLEALVRMKLVANRLRDRVHLQDLVRVGLIDQSWLTKYPPELAERLKPHIADPNA
jgi:hypothetical protein